MFVRICCEMWLVNLSLGPVNLSVYVYIYIYIYIYIYVCVCVFVCVYIYIYIYMGHGVAQWLRHCATSRSRDRIPVASVTGIFLVDTDRTMCPGVNSASKK